MHLPKIQFIEFIFGNFMVYSKLSELTPQAQLSIQWTFFPFGLKWIPLLRRHVLIAIKTFSPKVKTINSSLIKNIYIFDISYHFLQSEQNKSEVWKGKNLCAWGVKIKGIYFDEKNIHWFVSLKCCRGFRSRLDLRNLFLGIRNPRREIFS